MSKIWAADHRSSRSLANSYRPESSNWMRLITTMAAERARPADNLGWTFAVRQARRRRLSKSPPIARRAIALRGPVKNCCVGESATGFVRARSRDGALSIDKTSRGDAAIAPICRWGAARSQHEFFSGLSSTDAQSATERLAATRSRRISSVPASTSRSHPDRHCPPQFARSTRAECSQSPWR